MTDLSQIQLVFPPPIKSGQKRLKLFRRNIFLQAPCLHEGEFREIGGGRK